MNDEHVLKVACEGIKLGTGKYREMFAAPTVYPTMARVHLKKLHMGNLAPISKKNKRCTSQHTCITIVEHEILT